MKKETKVYDFLDILEIIIMITDNKKEDLENLSKYRTQKSLIPIEIQELVELDIKDCIEENSLTSNFLEIERKRKEFYNELGYEYTPIQEYFPTIEFF